MNASAKRDRWALVGNTHVQYARTESGRQTVKVDPSTGSQVVTLLREVKSATGSQVERMAVAISAGGDGS